MEGLAVTVLLRHDSPEGTGHYDWLLESPEDPGGALIAFRVDTRIDEPGAMGFSGVRMPDHRRVYLTYEGEIGGNRGTVARVAEGRCRFHWLAAAGVRVTVTFRGRSRTWDGRLAGEGGRWEFQAAPIDP